MTITCGSGDEKLLEEMSDEELIRERDYWNKQLRDMFFKSSATYDTGAAVVTHIENELNRREHEGPPWIVD